MTDIAPPEVQDAALALAPATPAAPLPEVVVPAPAAPLPPVVETPPGPPVSVSYRTPAGASSITCSRYTVRDGEGVNGPFILTFYDGHGSQERMVAAVSRVVEFQEAPAENT